MSNSTEEVVNLAYQYGRNLGIAFQLVDDLLDYVSCQAMLGKPAAADLKLGLATAPVLFAAQEVSVLFQYFKFNIKWKKPIKCGFV